MPDTAVPSAAVTAPGPARKGLIDLHTHAIAPSLPDLAAIAPWARWPSVEQSSETDARILVGGRPYRNIDSRCWSAGRRLADMDAEDVALQVISPVPVTFCHDAPADGAAVLASAQNDFLAELVAQQPDRFRALGAVPLQDPGLAAAELRRCVRQLGFLGVEIGTRVGDRELGDTCFDPFFDTAAELGALVLVHPADITLDPRLAKLGVAFGAGLPGETGAAAAGLLASGALLRRRSGARLCLAHAGGTLPWLLPRLDKGELIKNPDTPPERLPSALARSLYSDSLTYDVESLLLAVHRYGADHVMLGTDYPFAARESPAGAVTDEHMADLLRWTLMDPDIPTAAKDPANWPALMRREWADDGGTSAATAHRRELREHLARCRTALDAFQPDVLVVWGDDQYENFREEVVPPFCVLAYGDTEVDPFAVMNERGAPNAWGLPDDMTFTLHGDAHSARQLADDLLNDGFDVAYSYEKRRGSHFPHAIANTQLFLDYDNAGREFPYKILPITVNCYGQHAIARRGGLARFADIHDERPDPAGPSPARCFALGTAVARAMSKTGKRVALAASSSWSHAFLNDKNWHLRPDTVTDQRLYDAFVRGDYGTWTAVTGKEIVAAGQHEMLNWFCLAGAMHELRMGLTWSALVITDVFNSNKCFAIFDGKASQ